MAEQPEMVDREIRISRQCAEQLSRTARAEGVSDGQIVESALTMLFALLDLLAGRGGGHAARSTSPLTAADIAKSAPVGGDTEEAREAQLWQRLLELGLVSAPKPPTPLVEERPFRPIEVRGKPLSEMVIEERR